MEQYLLYEEGALQNNGSYGSMETRFQGYLRVGEGIQLDISILGIGKVGLEIIWFDETLVDDAEGPQIYIYGGGQISVTTKLQIDKAKEEINMIIEEFSALNSPTKKNLKLLGKLLSGGSISYLNIYGDVYGVDDVEGKFESTKDYTKWFAFNEGTIGYINSGMAVGANVYSVSTGISTSIIDLSTGVTYYTQIN